jgi:hypothetical protein
MILYTLGFHCCKKCSECLPSASVHILTHFTISQQGVLATDECGLGVLNITVSSVPGKYSREHGVQQ